MWSFTCLITQLITTPFLDCGPEDGVESIFGLVVLSNVLHIDTNVP